MALSCCWNENPATNKSVLVVVAVVGVLLESFATFAAWQRATGGRCLCVYNTSALLLWILTVLFSLPTSVQTVICQSRLSVSPLGLLLRNV